MEPFGKVRSKKEESASLTTTSDSDLKNLALKHRLKGFKIWSADQLPPRIPATVSGIVNQDDRQGTGTHWVAFYSSPETEYVYYFDSFGVAPDPRLLKHMRSSGKPVVGMSLPVQHLNSKACGYYCIAFLKAMNRGDSFPSFMAQWTTDEKENEKRLFRLSTL